jgi:hypothetical protein
MRQGRGQERHGVPARRQLQRLARGGGGGGADEGHARVDRSERSGVGRRPRATQCVERERGGPLRRAPLDQGWAKHDSPHGPGMVLKPCIFSQDRNLDNYGNP